MRQRAIEMSNRIAGPMTKDEIFWIADRVSSNMRILELGCLHGKVTRVLANAAVGVHVDVVDNFVGQPHTEPMPNYHRGQFLRNLKNEIEHGLVTLHEMTTQIFNHRNGAEEGIYDLIWIDADHSYEAVVNDVALAWRLAKPESLICGHDLDWWEVRRALDDFKIPYHQVSKDNPLRRGAKNSIWWAER